MLWGPRAHQTLALGRQGWPGFLFSREGSVTDKSSFTALMMSQCQAPQSVEYSRCLDWVPKRIPFSDPENCILNTKPQRGCPNT